jgi:hypothetical protein
MLTNRYGLVIIYDLKCENGHKFEGWFQDRMAFEEQRDQKLISCPICGSLNSEVAPSSLTVVSRDNKADKVKNREISPLQALKMLNEFIDNNFEDVGANFAEVATRIHHGEEMERNIKGTTTRDEEETLREEGIHFIKIPTPKFDS